MKRLYSSYPDYEFEEVVKEAEKMGLSLSAFQRYCVMVYLADKNPGFDFLSMGFYDSISMRLEKIKPGETFTVADLFPNEWASFDNSRRMMIAKQLVKFSKNNPHICSIYQSEPGKTMVYIKNTGMSWADIEHARKFR